MYLTVSDVSGLLGISCRAIRKTIKSYKHRLTENFNGGYPKYEIDLESLPIEAQQRYWAQTQQAQAIEASKPRRGRPTKAAKQAQAEAQATQEAEIQANRAYVEAPRWQKDTVDRRLQIVCETLDLGRKELIQEIL